MFKYFDSKKKKRKQKVTWDPKFFVYFNFWNALEGREDISKDFCL